MKAFLAAVLVPAEAEDVYKRQALTDDTIVRPTVNMIYGYQFVADKVQSARFVKLEVTSDSSWTFLDEFRVLEYPQSCLLYTS